ncbi:NTF2-like N-terminal transpeptidase domain-containing protein, partial [Actinophytocola sp.]|uniref:NTF2-like N-terminal transpeptidase domain-containing protein n=1 Tax=Actinophytocola sp. TaxID=1872138 RepID=UPI002D306E0A
MSADQRERYTSRTKKTLIIGAGALLAAVITFVGLLQLRPDGDNAASPTTSAPPPELTATDVTNQFLDALTHGQAAAAGRLTDDERAATTQLADVWRTLQPSAATARPTLVTPPPEATAADERFTLTWRLGPDRTWEYESGLRLVKAGTGWRVQWRPGIVHPRLAAGQSLAMRDGVGQPAVLDRDGTPLLTWTET